MTRNNNVLSTVEIETFLWLRLITPKPINPAGQQYWSKDLDPPGW